MIARGSLLLAIALLAVSGGRPRAQSSDVTAATLVERAGRYVEAYEAAFSALVCEERQVQTLVRPDGRARQTRQLRSDFLLVKLGTVGTAVFRDVLDVDGKPTRNREDRLRKLFLDQPKTAVEQARAIARESQRHNIGLSRTGNSPLLPLKVLMPRTASGFRFALAGSSLTFEEFRSPSLLSWRRGDAHHDLMARGSFVIDAEGRVLSAELTADAPPPSYSVSLSVRYRDDPQLKLLVPVDVTERYWRPSKPGDDHLEVAATYSNFRRFQVTTDEQIKVPK